MTTEEFDTLVEKWHQGDGTGLKLHEYLGMTWEEYKSYLCPKQTQTNSEQIFLK